MFLNTEWARFQQLMHCGVWSTDLSQKRLKYPRVSSNNLVYNNVALIYAMKIMKMLQMVTYNIELNDSGNQSKDVYLQISGSLIPINKTTPSHRRIRQQLFCHFLVIFFA